MAHNTQVRKPAKKKTKLKHPIRFAAILYFLALVILLGIIYVLPWVSDQMSDVMTIEYGDLNNTQTQTFYFVKYETVYLADESGKAGYSFNEGNMISTGSVAIDIVKDKKITDNTDYDDFNARVNSFIAGDSLLRKIDADEKQDLIDDYREKAKKTKNRARKLQLELAVLSLENAGSNGSQDPQNLLRNISRSGLSGRYKVDTSGIISYRVDGYEAALSPYTMKYLDKKEVREIRNDSTDLFDGTVTKGEPVCKIVSNRTWYTVTWTEKSRAEKFIKGASVTLQLESGDVEGKVHRVIRQGNDYLVILKFDSYCSDIVSLRKEKCKVITSNERGLIIRESYITKKKGKEGVYVIDVTGKASFTPIKVIARDDGYALVASGSFTEDGVTYNTVNVNDQIRKVSQEETDESG